MTMDLAAVLRALTRRWYVVLVGLLVTAGLGYVVIGKVPPTYTASGTVLLLPPTASVEGENPLLQLGGLEQPSSLVVATLAGSTARAAFAEQFPTATYDIVVDPLSRGPLIVVTAEDTSSQGAMDMLGAVLDQIPVQLEALQDDVSAPASARLGSTALTVDLEPTSSNKDALRAIVVVGVGGVALTLVVAVGLERLARQRPARRAAKAGTARAAKAGRDTETSSPSENVRASSDTREDSLDADGGPREPRTKDRGRDSRRVAIR